MRKLGHWALFLVGLDMRHEDSNVSAVLKLGAFIPASLQIASKEPRYLN